MAQIKDIEQYREQKKRKKIVHRIIIGSVLLFLIIVGAILIPRAINGELTLWWRAQTGQGSQTQGFPVTLPSGKAVSLRQAGSDFVLLGDSSLYVYNSFGVELNRVQHGYGDPGMAVAGNRILVFDRGGNGVKVCTKSQEVFKKTFETTIFTAALSEDGKVAVATAAEGYAAELTVCDSKNRELFRVGLTEQVSGLTFSPDGKKITILTVSSEGGKMFSSVITFRLDSSNALYRTDYADVLLLSASYKADGKLCVVGDTLTALLNDAGDTVAEYNYEDRELITFSAKPDGSVVLVFTDPANNRIKQIEIVDSAGRLIGKGESESNKAIIDCDGSRVLFLADDTLRFFDMQGSLINEIEVDRTGCGITAAGSYVYVMTEEEIHRFSVS
ncbi:MAG: hypothetical protein E7486_06560 [Ruminococcaceae bacterium]|nr:hypothetical protein [Oscillospiraceae bacterium]